MKANEGNLGSGPPVVDNTEKRRRIDDINRWVLEYKTAGSGDARMSLLVQFHPFLIKQSKKFGDIYSGVHPWDHILHEAQIIFCDLLDEFTIGGTAYFNVYIQRKLPFRLRYFFIKEIRRRGKCLSHSDEQLAQLGDSEMPVVDDYADDVAYDMDTRASFGIVMNEIRTGPSLTRRDRDVLIRHLLQGHSHESIAASYGISRSRISRVIKLAILKVRKGLGIHE